VLGLGIGDRQCTVVRGRLGSAEFLGK